jgi:predicted ribosomally synthesized peptide with SipW-like signal peptide
MKRLLICACVAAAVFAIGGARAYFTAQTEVKDNVITAGTLAFSVEPTAAALSIDPLAPGQTVERTVEIRNTGVLTCDASTTAAKKAGYTDLWSALRCRVLCEGQLLYDGPLAALKTEAVRIAPGLAARLDYAISLPIDAGNDLQGDYVRASLYVDAEQAR